MRTLLITVSIALFCAPLRSEEPKGFTPLFDKKTLAGWEGNRELFRVQQQSIVAGRLTQKIPHNEFLCTVREFGDFELRLKAKLVGEGRNAGIQFRSQRVPNHTEVRGYQCDMGQNRGKNIWGALYDESRRRRFLAYGDQEKLRKIAKRDDWNEIVVRCRGAKIEIWVNGLQTVDYTEKEKEIARRGIIGLQIHSGPPSEAWYKDISIKEL